MSTAARPSGITARALPARAHPASDLIAGLLSPVGVVIIAALACAFLALFFRWFFFQHQHSSGAMEDWGHAYFIPLISLYMIWQKREELARTPVAAFWPGILPLVLGMLAYFQCVVGIRNHMLQGWAMLLTLFGLLLLVLGPGMMRHLFLPVAFLIFGITISERIMIQITFPLQLIAAQGASVLLAMIGLVANFSVDVTGNILTVITSKGDEVPLDVAEACSGMRMVVAFLALGGATALLGCKYWWQRVAVMLLAAPVAILLNVVRVAVLGMLTLYDPELARGEAHTLVGTLLLIPGLGLFLGMVWALHRVVKEPGNSLEAVAQPTRTAAAVGGRS